MDNSYKKFEKIIEKKGLSTYRVAVDTGISKPVFTYWKNGRSKPSLNTMIKISNYLNVSIEELIA